MPDHKFVYQIELKITFRSLRIGTIIHSELSSSTPEPELAALVASFDTVMCDCDGVLYTGPREEDGQGLPGVGERNFEYFGSK